MSNKLLKIFLLSYFLLLSIAYGQPVNESLLAEANALFEDGAYENAADLYENIYAGGYFDEQMLYHMAFACEHLGKVPESIYYLRKAQWEYGNSLTNAKVAQLVQEIGASRFVIATEWSSYRAFIHRSYGWWLLLIAVLLGLAFAMLWRSRNSKGLIAGIAISSMGLFVALLLVEHSFISPDQGVIIRDTSFYEQPAYTANSREIPISPGTLVYIKSRHDIWYHVAVGHYDCWVPSFAVLQL